MLPHKKDVAASEKFAATVFLGVCVEASYARLAWKARA